MEDGEGCVRQEIESDRAVSPSRLNRLLKHLVIGLFQPLKATRWTNQGSLHAATAKEELEVKWTGEKTCDWANAVKASRSPFSMSTVSRVKGRQMQNYKRQGEGGNVSLSP